MRVLHVLDISIPMLAGYTSRSRYIVNNQKALGLDPVVLTSVRHDSENGAIMETLDGIRYHRTSKPKRTSLSDRIENTPVAREGHEIQHLRRRILNVAKEERPDIIHAHSSILCGIPAYLAARQLGVPCVYEIRAFWEDAAVDAGTNVAGSPKYVAIQRAETQLARRADALVGICQGIKNELIGRGISASDVFVIPNGVEADRFVPTTPDPAVLERFGFSGKKVVAYIGTFAAFEGVPYLVRALIDLIKGGRDDVRGLIVGAGRTYDECRRLAAEAGLEKEIAHPGRVDHAEIKSIYSVVDILAYPRDSQRITELVTPLKPLEAMAMEKAVIGSDVGGLVELISDERNGLIFRHEDVGDLARTIERLLDDDALRARLGKQGRKQVKAERDWRKIIEGHFELYDRARINWSKNQLVWKGIASVASRLPS